MSNGDTGTNTVNGAGKILKELIIHRYGKGKALCVLCQFLGWVLLCASGAVATIAMLNTETRAQGGHDLSAFWKVSFLFFVLGVLQIFRVASAFVFSSVCGVAVGIYIIVGTIFHVPSPWCLLNVSMGILLAMPMLALLTIWKRDAARNNRSKRGGKFLFSPTEDGKET